MRYLTSLPAKAFKHYRSYREVREMLRLDSRILSDIGISRGDVHSALAAHGRKGKTAVNYLVNSAQERKKAGLIARSCQIHSSIHLHPEPMTGTYHPKRK
ncbi:DUF1127 domain-containing protein [Flexibacterium corallicola]|uniref:DUF1127 domain-containing protein n=1 Tax=Flexibacterium corallicola TaxID=3037259 RepID=UPI00286EE8A7|nr:DUF1127 domain-containing protein [Pseudovibrio sp. M1P-2-3]